MAVETKTSAGKICSLSESDCEVCPHLSTEKNLQADCFPAANRPTN